MEEIMIKIENVSKRYKLGEIGGTTLRDELQRWSARMHGREDPTKMIGAKDYNKGEIFMALDGVSFEVKKGERVGIIGHNGAGKSTLLKLISRVTAPTGGWIGLNGRVASMLEVGTGFHGELTGRENIYMNGAILGMTRKEIDAKIEDIIEFSECRQFIDTPVKRYSSGMYVKLAFSVAAHLDSEIMIMDEVLAVGDMAFQKKCLEKMSDVSKSQGRTILYVSHNMNTIRQLCDRVVVLDHGKVVFDGDVEEGIAVYMGRGLSKNPVNSWILVSSERHDEWSKTFVIEQVKINNKTDIIIRGEDFVFSIAISNRDGVKKKIHLRAIIKNEKNDPVTMMFSDEIVIFRDFSYYTVFLKTNILAPAKYSVNLALYELGGNEVSKNIDVIRDVLTFTIVEKENPPYDMSWNTLYWGHIISNRLLVQDDGFGSKKI